MPEEFAWSSATPPRKGGGSPKGLTPQIACKSQLNLTGTRAKFEENVETPVAGESPAPRCRTHESLRVSRPDIPFQKLIRARLLRLLRRVRMSGSKPRQHQSLKFRHQFGILPGDVGEFTGIGLQVI